MKTLLERFKEKYIPLTESGCWIWMDALDKDGYGRLQVKGKAMKAHKLSYKLFKGPAPKGAFICHKCDTPSCVNPEHLYAGTALQNVQDCVSKGRNRFGINPQPGVLNGRSKLTEKQVKNIRSLHKKGVPTTELLTKFKVTRSAINRITSKKTWRHIS